MASNVGILKIHLNWSPPTNPRGNVTAYRVSLVVTYTRVYYIYSRVKNIRYILFNCEIILVLV